MAPYINCWQTDVGLIVSRGCLLVNSEALVVLRKD